MSNEHHAMLVTDFVNLEGYTAGMTAERLVEEVRKGTSALDYFVLKNSHDPFLSSDPVQGGYNAMDSAFFEAEAAQGLSFLLPKEALSSPESLTTSEVATFVLAGRSSIRGHIYETELLQSFKSGIIDAAAIDSFEPGRPVTLSQAVQFAVGALVASGKPTAAEVVAGTPGSSLSEASLAWAKANGLVPRESSLAELSALVTRQQVMSLYRRASEWAIGHPLDDTPPDFRDLDALVLADLDSVVGAADIIAMSKFCKTASTFLEKSDPVFLPATSLLLRRLSLLIILR